MTTATYAAALELAEQLTSEERQRLLEELDQGVTAPRTLAGAATAVPDTGSVPSIPCGQDSKPIWTRLIPSRPK
ncbi:MAG TPA: hypothetical protein VLA19_16940 [Herpetosiphonaceae bacterium]|nr:hypothetical protein [Herpetosiphonaceae bacterium]